MRIVIDAWNIRAGGGLTHLREVLSAVDPRSYGIDRIFLWSSAKTLALIEDRPWLEKFESPSGGIVDRVLGERIAFRRLLRSVNADLLFVPGGSVLTWMRPVVTMHRSLLPFDAAETRRYGVSPFALKLRLLRWIQVFSMRRADGVIFLTDYAREAVRPIVGAVKREPVIGHGVNPRFRSPPRPPRPVSDCSTQDPLRIVYVSTVDLYKNQWTVVEAVAMLRSEGIPLRLDLYGAAQKTALRRLRSAIARWDPTGQFVTYHGEGRHGDLGNIYQTTDIFVFASNCETFSNILVESMASGLAIACSDRSAMPSVLGEAGVFFDPEDAVSIAKAIGQLVHDVDLRAAVAEAAYQRSRLFTWERCAQETMRFLSAIGQGGIDDRVPQTRL